jgi:hypothetical protein
VVTGQAGVSMIELLVTMVALSFVLAGLTTAFVGGSRAEVDANRRVQAQIQAAAAFDRLRRDVHCAGSATAATGSPTITLSGCGAGTVSWCALGSGTRYTLYRALGTTCDATGKLYADYLTSPAIFTYTPSVLATSLANVYADIVVNVFPTKTVDTYELKDDIVMRNSTRT